jgi:N-methylhydantoinase B
MGALAQVVPERVIAGCEGGPTLFSIGGRQNGKPFVLTEVMVGTWGSRAELDGIEGISNPAANLSNNPVELIEAELPLQVTEYSFVADSGGPGRRRGGLAFSRTYRVLADNAQCTMRADRRDHPPYGLAGGEPGGGSLNVLNPGEANERKLPTMPMASICTRATCSSMSRRVVAASARRSRANPNWCSTMFARKRFRGRRRKNAMAS